VLELLRLSEPFDAPEPELETLRVSRLRDSLMELGKGFSFWSPIQNPSEVPK
jgi:predicted nuclease of restriction endonuclease-like (RecB) superfamily